MGGGGLPNQFPIGCWFGVWGWGILQVSNWLLVGWGDGGYPTKIQLVAGWVVGG